MLANIASTHCFLLWSNAFYYREKRTRPSNGSVCEIALYGDVALNSDIALTSISGGVSSMKASMAYLSPWTNVILEFQIQSVHVGSLTLEI